MTNYKLVSSQLSIKISFLRYLQDGKSGKMSSFSARNTSPLKNAPLSGISNKSACWDVNLANKVFSESLNELGPNGKLEWIQSNNLIMLKFANKIVVHTPEHTTLQAAPTDSAAALTSEFKDDLIANRVEEDELGRYLQDNFTKAHSGPSKPQSALPGSQTVRRLLYHQPLAQPGLWDWLETASARWIWT